MIRDLLVPVLLGEVNDAAVEAACGLARQFGAQVTGLVGVASVVPVSTAWSYYPVGVYETINEAARTAAAELRDTLAARLERHCVDSECHVADSPLLAPANMAALHALHVDLVVLGRGAEPAADAERAVFGDLLLGSGRPVLLVPAGWRWPERLERVVVAWRATPEASRALHDAMPLLRQAGAVEVLMVDPKVGDDAHAALPGADIGAHLARHGLEVEVRSIPNAGDSTGAAILRHCRENGTQLLVAGGYGHSRLRQQMFGGVTRALLEDATMPVLFSH